MQDTLVELPLTPMVAVAGLFIALFIWWLVVQWLFQTPRKTGSFGKQGGIGYSKAQRYNAAQTTNEGANVSSEHINDKKTSINVDTKVNTSKHTELLKSSVYRGHINSAANTRADRTTSISNARLSLGIEHTSLSQNPTKEERRNAQSPVSSNTGDQPTGTTHTSGKANPSDTTNGATNKTDANDSSKATNESDPANPLVATNRSDTANPSIATSESNAVNPSRATNKSDPADSPVTTNRSDAANPSIAKIESNAANSSRANNKSDPADSPVTTNKSDTANASATKTPEPNSVDTNSRQTAPTENKPTDNKPTEQARLSIVASTGKPAETKTGNQSDSNETAETTNKPRDKSTGTDRSPGRTPYRTAAKTSRLEPEASLHIPLPHRPLTETPDSEVALLPEANSPESPETGIAGLLLSDTPPAAESAPNFVQPVTALPNTADQRREIAEKDAIIQRLQDQVSALESAKDTEQANRPAGKPDSPQPRTAIDHGATEELQSKYLDAMEKLSLQQSKVGKLQSALSELQATKAPVHASAKPVAHDRPSLLSKIRVLDSRTAGNRG